MKKIKLRFTWHEIGEGLLDSLKGIGENLVVLLFSIILVPVNLIIRLGDWLKQEITERPIPSVIATFCAMLTIGVFACIITYAQFKCKLTTAEWQRDSMEMKLDSINALHDPTIGYTRFQPYKSH